MTDRLKPPTAHGLYDPTYEHDACGVALVARLDNVSSHDVVEKALLALENLEHRGAAGADKHTGDGAGILLQMPDALPARLWSTSSCRRPASTAWRCASCRPTPRGARRSSGCSSSTRASRASACSAGATCPSTRSTSARRPTAPGRTSASSSSARAPASRTDQDAFERKLYVIRRVCELAAGPDFYVASFSSRTLVYKGMLISYQVAQFFGDLRDERMESAMGLVHSRFSTNTFP